MFLGVSFARFAGGLRYLQYLYCTLESVASVASGCSSFLRTGRSRTCHRIRRPTRGEATATIEDGEDSGGGGGWLRASRNAADCLDVGRGDEKRGIHLGRSIHSMSSGAPCPGHPQYRRGASDCCSSAACVADGVFAFAICSSGGSLGFRSATLVSACWLGRQRGPRWGYRNTGSQAYEFCRIIPLVTPWWGLGPGTAAS